MSETRNALIFIREQLGSFISVTQINDSILCSGNEQLHTFIALMNNVHDVHERPSRQSISGANALR